MFHPRSMCELPRQSGLHGVAELVHRMNVMLMMNVIPLPHHSPRCVEKTTFRNGYGRKWDISMRWGGGSNAL